MSLGSGLIRKRIPLRCSRLLHVERAITRNSVRRHCESLREYRTISQSHYVSTGAKFVGPCVIEYTINDITIDILKDNVNSLFGFSLLSHQTTT